MIATKDFIILEPTIIGVGFEVLFHPIHPPIPPLKNPQNPHINFRKTRFIQKEDRHLR
jgi:hypothetical protein